MGDNAVSTTQSAEDEPQPLAELFHLIKSLVPEGQDVLCLPPRATVAEAVKRMREHRYSQVPVVAGQTVLRVFSYRSLVTRLLELGTVNQAIGDLPIDEFSERPTFGQSGENWESVLDDLDRLDAVLVGSREHLEGILTAMDVLSYLRQIANPFVMLAEIELSLRRIIGATLNDQELQECMKASLDNKYGEAMPRRLSGLTFNDYATIVCNPRNWPRFHAAFGEGAWQRQLTSKNLTQVRELRNVVFHFRRQLTPEEVDTLASHRDWLQMKTLQYEAGRGKAAKPAPGPLGGAAKWDEASFMRALTVQRGAEVAQVAQALLSWAGRTCTYVWWGKGKAVGSFVPVLVLGRTKHQLFAVCTDGTIHFYFQFYAYEPPFDDEERRLELLKRLNRIQGISLPQDAINRQPPASLEVLADASALRGLLAVLDWMVSEVRAASAGRVRQ